MPELTVYIRWGMGGCFNWESEHIYGHNILKTTLSNVANSQPWMQIVQYLISAKLCCKDSSAVKIFDVGKDAGMFTP